MGCSLRESPPGAARQAGHFFLLAQEKVTKKKGLKLFDRASTRPSALTPPELRLDFGQRAPCQQFAPRLRGPGAPALAQQTWTTLCATAPVGAAQVTPVPRSERVQQ